MQKGAEEAETGMGLVAGAIWEVGTASGVGEEGVIRNKSCPGLG